MTVHVTEATADAEWRASAAALRDILYTYLDLCADCLPTGDWSRAERGTTDPFRYLDIHYAGTVAIRTPAEERLLHEGAAVQLLCRLADAAETDEASGSRTVEAVAEAVARGASSGEIAAVSPELARIARAWRRGRIVPEPSIQRAFEAAFTPGEHVHDHLRAVREQVVVPAFARVSGEVGDAGRA